jgi:predicted MarR family transcription regulator
MQRTIDKTWHLAKNTDEVKVTEFEFHLWRVFNGFLRWQEDNQQYIGNTPLSGYELALLHVVRMNDRPKTIYELARLLNRDDPNNVQYSLGKLTKLGLIKRTHNPNSKKALSYEITQKGIDDTNAYCRARSDILIELFKNFGFENLDLEVTTKTLITLKEFYDEASRMAAVYKVT